MVHFQKAEQYYQMRKIDEAINLFYTYVEKCDAGTYHNKELRSVALEFLALAFSEYKNGYKKATTFLKKNNGKPYESYILYTIGIGTMPKVSTTRPLPPSHRHLNDFPTTRMLLLPVKRLKRVILQ